MTWNEKKKWVDCQGYYVFEAIYQTAEVCNSNLFLYQDNFFSYALDSEFTEYILYASMCLVFGPHDSEKAGISSYRKWA